MLQKTSNIICCPSCGIIIDIKGHHPHRSLHCYRCHTLLHKKTYHPENISLLMGITSIILFIPTLYFPLLKISLFQFESQINLWNAIYSLFEAHYPFLGLAVALTTLLIPLFYSILITIAFTLKKNCRLSRKILKTLHLIEQWHMVDVFLLGVLVSIVKLVGNFDLQIGTGFYFLITLAITITITKATFDLQSIWRRLQ
jgi:paraquat-inducible protein A